MADSFSLPLVLLLELMVQGVLFLGGHVDHKVHHLVSVANFIVVPGNVLDKMVFKVNDSPNIKDGRVGVTIKVSGDSPLMPILLPS